MLTNPSCSNSSLSLCFDYGDTMPITGYDVSKSGCCPSSEEGFAAKTGYAESELRDARSRLSPSADSQATAKRAGPRAHHLPERDWTVALSALESDSVEIGEMALPLFESEMIVTFLTAHSSSFHEQGIL